MEEKEKVLKQIDNINSSFLDIEKFIPWSPNSYIVFGIMSIALYLGIVPADMGYSFWLFFTVIGIFSAYFIHLFLVRREMQKYNLTKYSKAQLFIEYVLVINISIVILLTHIFNADQVGPYGYAIGVLFIGFDLFIRGYVINNNLVKKTGLVMVFAGILMLISIFIFMSIFIPIFMPIAMSSFIIFIGYIEYVSALFGGVSLVWLGIMLKKNAKL